MKPIPEVAAAVEQAGTHGELLGELTSMAELAQSMVPSCVGVSLTVIVDDEPYTLTATSEPSAVLDAMQYLDERGPCLHATDTAEVIQVPDILDEDRWQLFAHAAVSRGIRSSLSMPIRDDRTQGVRGAINMYASEPHAFVDQHEVLAAAFQVRSEDMMTNADLSFMTLDYARELPERLEESAKVSQAVGVLIALRGWDPQVARQRLRAAAAKARIGVEQVATVILDLGVT